MEATHADRQPQVPQPLPIGARRLGLASFQAGLAIAAVLATTLTGCTTVTPMKTVPVTRTVKVRVVLADPGIPQEEFQQAIAAVQAQVHRDLAPTWGVDATFGDEGEYTVTVEPGPAGQGALGQFWPRHAHVYTNRCRHNGTPWTWTLSHETLGMLVGPRQDGSDICDPANNLSRAYEINDITVSGFARQDGELHQGG